MPRRDNNWVWNFMSGHNKHGGKVSDKTTSSPWEAKPAPPYPVTRVGGTGESSTPIKRGANPTYTSGKGHTQTGRIVHSSGVRTVGRPKH